MMKARQILILGMHRSGTSCLAGMLKESGVFFGEVSLQNEFNKKGNQEDQLVNQINDTILKENNSSWYQPAKAKHLSFVSRAKILMYKWKIQRKAKCNKASFYAIKDPRMVCVLDFWRDNDVIKIGTFRHPSKVARSLYDRSQKIKDGTQSYSIEKWLEVWYRYNTILLENHLKSGFFLVNFDWQKEIYFSAIENILEYDLDIAGNHLPSFFDSELVHQGSDDEIDVRYLELYNKLNKLALACYEDHKEN